MKFLKWIAFLSLVSCTDPKSETATEKDLEIETEISLRPIRIYDDLPEPIDQIDSLFQFEDLIPLAVPDSMFLSIVSEIKLIGDDYLVFDEKQAMLFRFDETGKFIRTYGSKGEGPGEYLGISDFEVSDGKVYLMSRGNQALFVFDVDSGEFLEKIDMGLWGDAMVALGHGEFLIYMNHTSANDYFNVVRIGQDGKELGSYFKYDPKLESSGISVSGFLMRSGQEVNFSKPFHDTVYAYDQKEKDFKAKYHTDLLSKFMMENQRDFKALASAETLVKSIRGGESMNGNYFLENSNYIVFNFLDYSTFKSGIMDKRNSEFIVFAYSSQNPVFKLFDNPQVLTDDDSLYFPIYGEKVLSEKYFDHKYKSEFQSKLQEELTLKGTDYPYFICISLIK